MVLSMEGIQKAILNSKPIDTIKMSGANRVQRLTVKDIKGFFTILKERRTTNDERITISERRRK